MISKKKMAIYSIALIIITALVTSVAVEYKYGEYKNVLLSDEEMLKLKTEFPNDYEKRIENLSEYIASSGKKYKSHLATIRKWSRNDFISKQAGQNPEEKKYDDLEELTRRRI